MREWQKVKLSTIITQCQNTEKIFDMENEHYITLSSYGKGAHERIIKDGKYPVPFLGYRVRNGQFIYSRIDARNGAYDIISPELDGYVVSKDFPVYDIDTEKVLPRFLLRSVLSSEFINQVKHSSFGATNRMRIKEDVFGNYTIALPPMEQQQEIVDILDAVLSIIKSRQSELSVLDDLVKARFVEMFENAGYPTERLGSICSKITDGTHKTPQYLSEGITFISAKNIVNGKLNFTDIKHISEEEYTEIQNRCQTEKGDILLSKSGSLGTPVIVETTERLGLFESLAVIKYDRNRILPEFLCEQLKLDKVQRQFKSGTKGVAVKHLHLGVISDTEISVPPLEVQRTFAIFVAQVDKSKSVIQKSLDETQLLFDKLMQDYFG